jgi:hypothetical protein
MEHYFEIQSNNFGAWLTLGSTWDRAKADAAAAALAAAGILARVVAVANPGAE